jgi:ankyrin repeat protein
MISKRNNLLINAIKNNDIEGILAELKNGADVSASDGFGLTPLHIAIKQCNTIAIRQLIECGANLHHVSNDNLNPMSYAAICGNIETIRTLTTFCADFEPAGVNHKSPLEYALESEKKDITEYLIRHGADVDCLSTDNETLLMKMCQQKNTAGVHLLLNAEAYTATKNNDGLSAIDFAIKRKSLPIFYNLAQRSLPLDAKKALNRQIIHITPSSLIFFLNAYLYIFKSIFKTNISDAWNKLGIKSKRHKKNNIQTDLLFRYLKIGDIENSHIAILDGADTHAYNQEGVPVLIAAARSINAIRAGNERKEWNNPEVTSDLAKFILRLLQEGCDPQQKDHQTGRTLLHEACQTNNLALLAILLHNKKTLQTMNLSDDALNRPLHYAAMTMSSTAIEWLASVGADINPVNREGVTPFHLTALKADYKSASVLLTRGASIYLKTRDGRTITDLLCRKNSDNAFQYLALVQARKIIIGAKSVFSINNPFTEIVRPTLTSGKSIHSALFKKSPKQ